MQARPRAPRRVHVAAAAVGRLGQGDSAVEPVVASRAATSAAVGGGSSAGSGTAPGFDRLLLGWLAPARRPTAKRKTSATAVPAKAVKTPAVHGAIPRVPAGDA